MIQFRADAQIRYSPQDAHRLAAWAAQGVIAASSLDTEDERRTAFTALLNEAPYMHIRGLVLAAAVELLIERGM